MPEREIRMLQPWIQLTGGYPRWRSYVNGYSLFVKKRRRLGSRMPGAATMEHEWFPSARVHAAQQRTTWKWLKEYSRSKGGRKASIQIFTLKHHLAEQSKSTEDCMRKAGHPNLFPTEPQISRATWKAVQEMQPEYLANFHVEGCSRNATRISSKFPCVGW